VKESGKQSIKYEYTMFCQKITETELSRRGGGPPNGAII